MVESDLHLALKNAVKKHHAKGCRCWYEFDMFPWGGSGSLRVDVCYQKKKRYYYTECETRPSIKRLQEKGRRRKEYRRRTMYRLVVTEQEYHKRDWRKLRGYFDTVYAYDVQEDAFTDALDLRFMGSLRDAALDVLMPIYWSKLYQSAYRWLIVRRNCLRWAVRAYLHCKACRLGIPHPWVFCPRDDCPDSQYY